MKVNYLGHSCVQLDINGTYVVFDPFITGNPLASHIDIMDIQADYIFLSHAHGDHVADLGVMQKVTQAQVVAIVETAEWAESIGVPKDKITGINFGGTIQTAFGSVKMVYALHTNSTPDGGYGGLPAGYLLEADGKRVYFAGDTALTLEMQLLADKPIDVAFLPIGGHFTMDVEDAIKAANLINCKHIIGIHYDTFPPIKIDQKQALAQFQAAGITLQLLAIGKQVALT